MCGAWLTLGSPFPGRWGQGSRDGSAVVHLPSLVWGVSLLSLVFASSTTITAVAKNTNTARELEPSPTSSVSGSQAAACFNIFVCDVLLL